MATRTPMENVDIALKDFSNSLVPSDEFIAEGKKLVQKIFEELKNKSRYPISRVYFGGSVGKQTAINCPDFDVTVFVNEEEPPFPKVLDDFEDILLLNENLKIVPTTIEKSRYSVCFTLEGGFTVDLLPAANFVQTHKLCGEEQADTQRKEVLRRIAKNPKKYSIYSSSLSESQMQFMKTQDGFTHELVRLTKFWYKTLYFGEYIAGAKTIVELIAVAAAEYEEGRDKKSLQRAFIKFLDMVSKIDSLKLMFQKKGDGKWKPVSQDDLKSTMKQGNLMPGGLHGIPGMALLERRSFIIEPANPFNDMAEGLSPTVVNKFKAFAEITRKRFNDVTLRVFIIGECPVLPYHELFQPLPLVLRHCGVLPTVSSPKYLVGCKQSQRMNPDMKVRNEELFRKREIQDFVGGVQLYIFSTVNSFVRSNPKATASEIQNMVQEMVDVSIDGCGKQQWVPSKDSEEDCDVTIGVPVTLYSGQPYQARVSMKWN